MKISLMWILIIVCWGLLMIQDTYDCILLNYVWFVGAVAMVDEIIIAISNAGFTIKMQNSRLTISPNKGEKDVDTSNPETGTH